MVRVPGFLPLPENVCTISVKNGLVRNIEAKGTEPERWVINPKQLSLVIDSAIPLKSVPLLGGKLSKTNVDFGIAPMALSKDKFTNSTLTIDITLNGGPIKSKLNYSLIKKLVPAGLWGESATPALTDKKFLENVATGIEITPADPPAAGETKKLDVDVFKFENDFFKNDFKWELESSFKLDKSADDRRTKIAESIGSKKERETLKAELGLQFDISIGKSVVDDFLTAPQIGTLELCQPK